MKINVIGVGNVLMRDEGAGVRAIESLQARYEFSPNVQLMDGGTLGMELLNPIQEADILIVADIVRYNVEPGTLHRLTFSELKSRITSKHSMHEVTFTETLTLAEIMGTLPETIIVGIEPKDISGWNTELSEPVLAAMPGFEQNILKEIEAAGGSWTLRHSSEEQTGAEWAPADAPRNTDETDA